MAEIEAAAKAQFEADQVAEVEAKRALGTWVSWREGGREVLAASLGDTETRNLWEAVWSAATTTSR